MFHLIGETLVEHLYQSKEELSKIDWTMKSAWISIAISVGFLAFVIQLNDITGNSGLAFFVFIAPLINGMRLTLKNELVMFTEPRDLLNCLGILFFPLLVLLCAILLAADTESTESGTMSFFDVVAYSLSALSGLYMLIKVSNINERINVHAGLIDRVCILYTKVIGSMLVCAAVMSKVESVTNSKNSTSETVREAAGLAILLILLKWLSKYIFNLNAVREKFSTGDKVGAEIVDHNSSVG